MNTILGSKMEMSQTYVDGSRVPVTKVLVGPCVVTQIKKEEKDGYWAIQIGFGEKKLKNTTKQIKGQLKAVLQKDTKMAPRYLREVRTTEEPKYKIGDIIKVSDIFVSGDLISVSGISKGKGFAGGVKRWHFSGGPKTHGQSDRQRAPGSIGQGTTPGRVYKGKHMAGHMGVDTVSYKGIEVIAVDKEANLITLKGGVPGPVGGLVILQNIGVIKGYTAP